MIFYKLKENFKIFFVAFQDKIGLFFKIKF